MPIFALALKSLMNRRATAALVVLSIAVSVLLLLGVEKLRADAKASFADTVSDVDLVVGARTGPIPLLLYSVFRIGDATNNISWRSYQDVAARPGVAWTVPLSLGDSHRGFRVLGTTLDYFSRYRYGRDRNLVFRAGEPFDDLYDVVLGADVAATLGYALGDRIVIAHGLGEAGFQKHEDKPFRVVGVLAKTGTPVDRTLHVSLEAIEAIHVDWRGGVRTPGMHATADEARAMDLRPKQITAFLVGLENRVAVFGLQRWINEYRREPLLAVLPGVALQQLWDLMGTAETALAAVSGAVVGTGLLGMLTMLLAGLAERRREMALLRAVGAGPRHIFALLVSEAAALTVAGAGLGVGLLYAGLLIARPIVDRRYGIWLSIGPPTERDAILLAVVVLAGLIAGAVPALRACRQSLADGMIARN